MPDKKYCLDEHWKNNMRDFTPKVAKADLEHGAYYAGRCRNASVARWDANRGLFLHWRTKFGERFLEEIKCPEDDIIFDVFVTEHKLDTVTEEIPLREA